MYVCMYVLLITNYRKCIHIWTVPTCTGMLNAMHHGCYPVGSPTETQIAPSTGLGKEADIHTGFTLQTRFAALWHKIIDESLYPPLTIPEEMPNLVSRCL